MSDLFPLLLCRALVDVLAERRPEEYKIDPGKLEENVECCNQRSTGCHTGSKSEGERTFDKFWNRLQILDNFFSSWYLAARLMPQR